MNLMTIILTASMFWMVIFLIILPFNIKQASVVKKGNDPGAPEVHFLKEKFFISSLIAVVLTILYWYIFYFEN